MSSNIQINDQTKKDSRLVGGGGDVIKTLVKKQKEIHNNSSIVESDIDDSDKLNPYASQTN